MLNVENLFVRFGEKPLFDGISFVINDGQRVALAGRNGQGKSTLMKILAGQQAPERGVVSLARGRTVGYLPQDVKPPEDDRTSVEEVLTGLPELETLEAEVARLTHDLAERHDDPSLLAQYGHSQARFEAMGGYGAQAKAKQILDGLGFSQKQIHGPLRHLSGGWLMRAQLGRLLLMRPDLLLLDEPTNHLDIETREWLLDYLKGVEGAVILTSHDRFFLDQLVSKVLELEGGKLEVYQGNYSKFEVEKKERLERLKAAHARQVVYLKQQWEWIEKNRTRASTASNAQSRIKQVEKIEKIELPPEPPEIRLRFPEPPNSGQLACRMTGLGKSYGENKVFSGLDLELEAGTRLAVCGRNGAGKTTLLKLLSGREQPTAGQLTLGHNVVIQYFSQYEDDLPPAHATLLQALEGVAPKDATHGHLRTVLGCFLFSGDDALKQIGALSGGERARLKLARMLLQPSNLLVLDEPTNHLDIHSKDLLLYALAHFGGTAVFVSHDREFTAALATSVLEIKDGRATSFPCKYEQYRWRIAQDEKAAQAKKSEGDSKKGGGGNKAAAAPVAVAAAPRVQSKEAQREVRRLQKKVEQLEQQIEQDEVRVAQLEKQMTLPGFFDDPVRSRPIVDEHGALKAKVDAAWAELDRAVNAVDQAQA